MTVKKSSPVGTIFGIIILVVVVAVLYYGLVIATQAGPKAEEAADVRADMEHIQHKL